MRYLSMSQLSQVTGRDRRTVKERLSGLEARIEGRSHLYDAHVAIPRILQTESQDDSFEKKLRDEELRYERERADKIALQNQKLRGEVVNIEDVAGVVESEYASVKAAMVALPSKVAGELSTMTSVIEIKKLLDRMINEALSELSSVDQFDIQPQQDAEADQDEMD